MLGQYDRTRKSIGRVVGMAQHDEDATIFVSPDSNQAVTADVALSIRIIPHIYGTPASI